MFNLSKFTSILGLLNSFIIFSILFFSVSSFSLEFPHTECLDEHLEAALALNKERFPIYSRLSGGESDKISRKLIKAEEKAVRQAKFLLNPLTFIHRTAGVPLGCLDFVSMDGVPEMKDEIIPSTVPMNTILWFDFKTFQSKWLGYAKIQFWNTLEGEIEKQLLQLSKTPEYQCMTRHVLESILRSVTLIPYYKKLKKERFAPFILPIQGRLIRSQIETLPLAHKLDKLAAPLQERGIPIICQDVPHIPPFSESELSEF